MGMLRGGRDFCLQPDGDQATRIQAPSACSWAVTRTTHEETARDCRCAQMPNYKRYGGVLVPGLPLAAEMRPLG
jgi:hypothetical protein